MRTGNDDLAVIAGYASPAEPGVRLATFDAGSGRLDLVAQVDGIENPSFVVVHPQAPWIYAVSEVGEAGAGGGEGGHGAVVAVRFDRAAHRLEVADRRSSGGGLPCHLELAPSGRHLVVSNYGSGSVEVIALDADGAMGEITDIQVHRGHGVDPERQEGPHAHSANFVPEGSHVVVNDLGIDQLAVYRFDHEHGRLERQGEVRVAPGAGPRHLAFHSDDQRVSVVNELASTVTTYGYGGQGSVTGQLDDVSTRGERFREAVVTPMPPEPNTAATPNTPAAIIYSAVNGRVYASNRGDDTIAVFDIDPAGTLTPAGVAPSGGHWPRDLAVSRDGRWMLVAHQFGGTVAVLPVQASGPGPGIGASVQDLSIPGASCVQWAASVIAG